MKKYTLILALIALLAALTTPAAGAQGAPKEAKLQQSIQIRTEKTAAVTAGDTAWVTVSIRGKKDVDNVKFTASLSDGDVAYPENTGDHSGPYNDLRLDKKETDYVAFKLTIPDDAEKKMKLNLTATWTEDGETLTGSDTVDVPIVQFDGDPYELLTDEVALSEADNGWVALSLAGLAPRVEGLQVSITDPSDLDVYYPLDTYTSLAGDDLLEDGETDEARFRLNEAHWGQTMSVQVEVRYLVAGVSESQSHTLTIAS